jgi:protein tyrosine phosphatase (PTP) superfamily phosphohydrolase (DUF442 family)
LIIPEFSKAFDNVPHKKLLWKLNNCGIRGNTWKWVSAFLSNRMQQVTLDGEVSGQLPVVSGVHQGSVLAPLLFLIFINDLPVAVTSKTRLFADDCILYIQIYNHDDSITLQQDMDNLAAWEKMWVCSSIQKKCISLSVTRSKTPFHTSYILKGHTLESITTAKYLGIALSKDMNWDTHINNIISKANKIIGFLRRNLPIQNTEIKTLAYKSMVRSNLEYCANVWSPHTENLKSKLEQVQRRAASYVTNRYHNTSSVSAMLNHLQLPILEHCRNLNRITMLYKITNNLIAVDPKLYLTPQPSLSTETIAHYNIKLYPPGQTIINTIFPHMQYYSGTHYLIQLLMLGPWIS